MGTAQSGALQPHPVCLAFQPIRGCVGEGATLFITDLQQGLIGRPGHGDRDALGLAAVDARNGGSLLRVEAKRGFHRLQ